jgi:hypothetical protein
MCIELISASSTPKDLVLTCDRTNVWSVSSSTTGYDSFEVLNVVGSPTYLNTTLELSDECRMIRNLAVFTDVEAINTLNGSIIQAFVYGSKPFTTSWSSYLYTSPSARQSALAKGGDQFWLAQEGEYSWGNSWLVNPFVDPHCTPSVCYMTANYVTTSIQLQQKYRMWVEYCTMNPNIPAQFVLDRSQEWLSAVSAFSQAFRFSENFSHVDVLMAVATAGKWLLSDAPPAKAIREGVLVAGKVALAAGLSLL